MTAVDRLKGSWQTIKDLLMGNGQSIPLRRGVGNTKREERVAMHEGRYPYDGGWYMPGITDKPQDPQQ